jgi:hypothetical protein
MAKYEYFWAEKLGASAHLAIHLMCRWLNVSTSGFYDWKSREASATRERRAALTVLVEEFFEASVQRYGYRRIHADLVAAGGPARRSWCAESCATKAWCRASPDLSVSPPKATLMRQIILKILGVHLTANFMSILARVDAVAARSVLRERVEASARALGVPRCPGWPPAS